MTDTQSPTTESQTTIDDARTRSRRSFIAVLKANRDVFSNLPERIEQWLEKETRATNQPETTKHGRDESERLARSNMQKQLECFQAEINANTQSLVTLDQTVREMTAALEAMKSVHSSMVFSKDRYVERELKEKEDTIEANKEQLKLVEEENLKLKEELKKKEEMAKDKIKEREERTEGLTNEHQKEVDKLLREIQTMKEKLLKKSDYIQKMYEDYNKNLADHKSRNDALLKEFEKREEEIAKYTQIIARLESEQEKKEKQIVEIAREEKEKTEGLTNEHRKEVDKLLREIQAMKEKNDTLLKEKEVEITNYTQMNLKLKEELKKEEKVAKEREERIALLEGEQEKKERQIVEIAKEVKEKTEGLTNEYQTEVDKLMREIQTTKERNDTLLKGLKNMEEEITKCTQINLTLKEEMKKKEEEAKEKIKELEERNDTLLKGKEEEIAKYTEMNLKLKEEFKQEEKEAKKKLKEQEERIALLEGEQEKKEKQIVEIAREVEEKTEGLTNEHQKEVGNLLREIQTIKGKNNTLLEKKKEEITKYTKMNLKLKEKLKKEEKEAKEKIKEREEREKELKEKCKALLESKDEELREMKMRLAHPSEKLVRKDQRKVEDTAAANRPSKVEEDFANFFDNERMDAIEKMQAVYGSEEDNDIGISYPRLACMIFEAAYEKTTEVKDSALHVFREAINEMINKAAELGEDYLRSEKFKLSSHKVSLKIPMYSQELKYPTEVLDTLLLSLKETALLCNLEFMKEDVKKRVTQKWKSWLASEKSCKFSFSDHLLFQLKDYIKACILLTWRMVVQVPPMQLEYQCTTLKSFHKMVGYHSSPEMCSRPPPNGQGAADDEIACYLWPALLDGGGRIIRRGEVLCKVKAEAV